MCLKLPKNYSKKVAEEDITVYKSIIFDLPDRDKNPIIFYTSYQYSPVEIGKTYESSIVIDENLDTIDIGLHSFVKLDDTIKEAKYYREIVVECVIPKGSEYYVGTALSEECESIVSNRLTYVRILENFEPEPESDPHEQPDMELT